MFWKRNRLRFISGRSTITAPNGYNGRSSKKKGLKESLVAGRKFCGISKKKDDAKKDENDGF